MNIIRTTSRDPLTKKTPKRTSSTRANHHTPFVIKSPLLIVRTKKPNHLSATFHIKNKKMHDFCFTIPYGMLLMVGGSMGYFKKGSIASLAGGAGTGFLVLLAGFITLKAFEKKKKSPVFAVVLQTGQFLS